MIPLFFIYKRPLSSLDNVVFSVSTLCSLCASVVNGLQAELDVIFRNDALIAINKPTGLLSVPGIGAHKQDCIATRAATAFPGARIVHRLDRDTSGIMVLALDAVTHRELSRQFHDREVEKSYIAIVSGHVEDDAGVIDLPMRKDMDPANRPRQVIDHERGRRAVTRYSVLERGAFEWDPCVRATPPRDETDERSVTRMELRPVTGRSHQLRLHMQAIGHPIVGDDLYAPGDVLALSKRLLLHAERLLVTDPFSGAPLRFHVPCPF